MNKKNKIPPKMPAVGMTASEQGKCPCCCRSLKDGKCYTYKCELSSPRPKHDKDDGFDPKERPEVTYFEASKHCSICEIKIPPDCEYTVNGQRVFSKTELRLAAQEFLRAGKRAEEIPHLKKRISINVIQAVFKGFGEILGVELWP